MPQYKIGQHTEIVIVRSNQEPNFDRACEAAYQRACRVFGCDDDGHINNVEGSERSRDSIVIEFKNYRHIGSMVGHECHYHFDAWVQRD